MVMNLDNERDRKKGLIISVDFSGQVQRKTHTAKSGLDQAMLANRRNQERLRQQRASANKSVLRTYRIKKNEKK